MQLIQLITCLMGQKLLLDANPSQPSSSNMVLLGTVLATLSDVMQRADNGMFIGFSVICEAVRAVSNLLPAYDFSSCLDDDNNNNNSEHHGVSTAIFELATQAIDKFLTSKSPNVRYSGVEALCALTQHNSKFALPHQTQVMLLLENKDEEESLLRVTIDLLLTMASAQNVDTIVHQVLHFIKRKSVHNNAHTTSLTPLLKMRATRGLIGLAGRYSSTPAAFIRLMHRIIFTAPEYIYREDVQLVLQVISHSFSESLFFPPEGADNNNNNTTDLFRIHLVELYYTLLGGDVRVFFNNNSNQDINPLLRHFLFYKGVLHHASSDCMSRSNTSLDNANSSTLMYENSLTSTTSVREGTPLTVGNSRLFTEKVVSQIKNFNLKNKIKIIPESVYKVGAWTIGEYGHLVQAYYHRHTSNNNNNNVGLGNAVFISLLLDSFEHCEEIETKSYILSALMKLTTNALHDNNNNNQNNNSELEDVLEHLTDQLTKYSKSHSVAVQQQCCEFLILLRQFPKVMKKMYHPNNNNNNNNNEEVDARLPFLDSIVQLAREKGAKEYNSNKQRSQPRRSVSSAATDGLKTKAYQPPSVGNAMTLHNNHNNNPMGVRNFFNQEFSIHNNNNNSALFSADAPNPTNLSNMFPDETITISSEVKRWGLNTNHHNSNNNTNNIVMSNSLTNSAIATHNNRNASNEQNAMSDFQQNNNDTVNVITTNGNNKPEEKTVKNKKLMNDIFGGAKPKESQPTVKKVVSLDKVQINNNNNNTKNPQNRVVRFSFYIQ
ncbi:Adaptin N terminal region containing protein, putative [Angomonas deanei]|uniref:Adaptin N terminal region containing protein, putative n=1 Tax=Angomonas deanei TaxID=59799 RepID=A0A7G2CGZ1_9TRYP|nr:Adaptin N terminal region containing protein, putative [Angomonas deanei]